MLRKGAYVFSCSAMSKSGAGWIASMESESSVVGQGVKTLLRLMVKKAELSNSKFRIITYAESEKFCMSDVSDDLKLAPGEIPKYVDACALCFLMENQRMAEFGLDSLFVMHPTLNGARMFVTRDLVRMIDLFSDKPRNPYLTNRTGFAYLDS